MENVINFRHGLRDIRWWGRAFLLIGLSGILLSVCVAQQPKFRIPFSVTDSSATPQTGTVYFGVHPDAFNCLPDLGHGYTITGFSDHWDLYRFGGNSYTRIFTSRPDSMDVYGLPPDGFSFEVRIRSLKNSDTCLGEGVYNYPRMYTDRHQIDTFRAVVAPATDPPEAIYDTKLYSWPSPTVLQQYCDSLILTGRQWYKDSIIDISGIDTIWIPRYQQLRISMQQESEFVARATESRVQSARIPVSDVLIIMYGPKVPPPPPDTIDALWPPNGGQDTSTALTPTLVWTAVPNGTMYYMQVSTDSTFTNNSASVMVFNDTVMATQQTMPTLTDGVTYYWRVVGLNDYGWSFFQHTPFRFIASTVVGVRDEGKHANRFALEQNFPNPFNPNTVIRYSSPVHGWVSLKVYDVLGREVTTLVGEMQQHGEHTVRWDASNKPSGVYFCRLVAGSFTETKKMLLLR